MAERERLTFVISDLRVKSTQAIDIRDNIESYCQGPQYSAFLNHLVPVFLKILDGSPVFISTSPEQVSGIIAACSGARMSNFARSGYGTASSRSCTASP